MVNGQTTAWNRLVKEQEFFGLHIQLLSSVPVKIREECYSDSGAGIKGTVYVREQGNCVGRFCVAFVPKLLRWPNVVVILSIQASLVLTGIRWHACKSASGWFGANWGFDLISLLCTVPNFDATATAGRFFGAIAGATKNYTPFFCAMALMCGSGVPTAKFAFCEGVFDASFLGALSNGYEKQGGETNTVDDNNLEWFQSSESDRMLAELGRNFCSRLYWQRRGCPTRSQGWEVSEATLQTRTQQPKQT